MISGSIFLFLHLVWLQLSSYLWCTLFLCYRTLISFVINICSLCSIQRMLLLLLLLLIRFSILLLYRLLLLLFILSLLIIITSSWIILLGIILITYLRGMSYFSCCESTTCTTIILLWRNVSIVIVFWWTITFVDSILFILRRASLNFTWSTIGKLLLLRLLWLNIFVLIFILYQMVKYLCFENEIKLEVRKHTLMISFNLPRHNLVVRTNTKFLLFMVAVNMQAVSSILVEIS